jgi:DNA-binding transcriptional ArsR family regulator
MILQKGSIDFREAQRISRLLFGNQDRLVVAAAIAGAEHGTIYGRNLAEQIGITDNRVGLQLKALAEAGLLTRLPQIGGDRIVYYERVESVFWKLVGSLAEEIAEWA